MTNLKAQLEAFEQGSFLDSDGTPNSGCFNFYDWFCKDSSLENKARALYPKVKTFLKHNPQIDPTQVYVFFKNNCPMRGPLYDDFRICTPEQVLFTVIPKCSHSGMAEIWGRDDSGEFGQLKVAQTFSKLFR